MFVRSGERARTGHTPYMSRSTSQIGHTRIGQHETDNRCSQVPSVSGTTTNPVVASSSAATSAPSTAPCLPTRGVGAQSSTRARPPRASGHVAPVVNDGTIQSSTFQCCASKAQQRWIAAVSHGHLHAYLCELLLACTTASLILHISTIRAASTSDD